MEMGRRAVRFLTRHHDLNDEWESQIQDTLISNPHYGSRIVHMKGRLFCSRRWRTGRYRILCDIIEDDRIVRVFDVDTRGDIY